MIFNNNNNNSTGSVITTSTNTTQMDSVNLISQNKPSITTIDGKLNVSTQSVEGGVQVSFSSKEITDQIDPTTIRTKLLTVYGKSGRIYTTSRDIETFDIKSTNFPARLEYKITTVNEGIEREYTADYVIAQYQTSSKITLSAKQTNTVTTVDVPTAVNVLDQEIYNMKNNFEKISIYYDTNQKKDVYLHNVIDNIQIQLNNLTTQINELKEKTKDL